MLNSVQIVDNVNNSKPHIYKSNSLIESSYKLSVSEQRIMYMGIKKLKPIFIKKNLSIEETQKLIMANIFDDIEIDALEYKKEFNIKSNNVYAELVEICDRLYERKIQYVDEDNQIVKKRWVITSKYDEANNRIKLRFHPDLIMDLLIFKNKFTVLRYDVAKSIKNSYTYRIYELMKQYEKIGKRSFTIGDFRYKLGIPDTEYPKYANMKQKIIKPSLDLLNGKSDIEIIFEEVKQKNKVVGIVFHVKGSKETPKRVIHEQISLDEVAITSEGSIYEQLKGITGVEISPEVAESIFDYAIESIAINKLQIGVLDFIKEKVSILEEYSKYNQIGNYTGTLIKAVQDNWKSNKKVSNFNNYEQRKYDMSELERNLLGWND